MFEPRQSQHRYLPAQRRKPESDSLSDPDVLAQEIIEDLEAALEQFREIASTRSAALAYLARIIHGSRKNDDTVSIER